MGRTLGSGKLVLALTLVVGTACTKVGSSPYVKTGGGLDSTGPTVDWATQVEPLFQQRCSACHGGSNGSAGFDVTSPATIAKGGFDAYGFTPCKPDESLLLVKVSSTPPPGGSPMPLGSTGLAADEIALLSQWIAEGGQDIYDPWTCGVSWELHIDPIFTKHGCNSNGCHDATTKSVGLDVTTPEGLAGVVTPCDGADSVIVDMVGPNPKAGIRMPLSSSFEVLSEAEIQLLADWIDQGAQATYDPAACP